MEILIAAVGRPRTPGVAEAIREYQRRASRYFRLRVVEISPVSLPDAEADRARNVEGAALLARVPEGLEVWALTRQGRGMDSRALADYLGELGAYGRPGVAFLIGGARGLSSQVLSRAQVRLSLSPMTLPHEMARLVLTEQLYRAGTILRGEPYHKGA